MGRGLDDWLDDERGNEQCDDVENLDHWVDGRTRGVLVRIAYRVAGNRGLVSIGALAPVVARLDELFRVVPRAASGGHGDGNEQASDDGTDEQASERVHAKAKAHDDRCKHGEQG